MSIEKVSATVLDGDPPLSSSARQISEVPVPQPSSAPPREKYYRPQLDVMRFFAFLTVLWTHTLPAIDPSVHGGKGHIVALLARATQGFGTNGVGLFFLLSAFLLGTLLEKEKQRTGTVHLRQFYVRRSLRIWPLYYLAILIGFSIQWLSPEYHLGWRILPFIFFYMNWNVALHGFLWNPIFILWTISCEEQFYAVWPLMLKYLSPRAVRSACLGALLLILLIAGLPNSLLTTGEARQFVLILLYFPLGGLLAFLPGDQQTPLRGRSCILLGVASLLLWEIGTLILRPGGNYTNVYSGLLVGNLIIALGTVGIFYAFARSHAKTWPDKIIQLGKITYGLYVFHTMMLDLVKWAGRSLHLQTQAGHSFANMGVVFLFQMPVALLLTVAVASLSFRYVETPFLELKERFAFVRSGA